MIIVDLNQTEEYSIMVKTYDDRQKVEEENNEHLEIYCDQPELAVETICLEDSHK